MSLNRHLTTQVYQRHTMNTSSVSTTDSSSSKMPPFPADREREQFPFYLYKGESYLRAKQLLDYINLPVYGISEVRGKPFIQDPSVTYLGSAGNAHKHQLNASKACDAIVQTLHPKQFTLINNITPGNAYAVMMKLKRTYGLEQSSNTHMVHFSSNWETI